MAEIYIKILNSNVCKKCLQKTGKGVFKTVFISQMNTLHFYKAAYMCVHYQSGLYVSV